LAQLVEELKKEPHMKLCQKDIFLTVSSMKHLMKLFLSYTRKEKLEIITSPSFFRRPTFRQIILKTVSASTEKLPHQRS
jgi:hypothetical protein